jgi:hypothetical protein
MNRQDILDGLLIKKDQYYHREMFEKISDFSYSYRLRIFLHNEKVIGVYQRSLF